MVDLILFICVISFCVIEAYLDGKKIGMTRQGHNWSIVARVILGLGVFVIHWLLIDDIYRSLFFIVALWGWFALLFDLVYNWSNPKVTNPFYIGTTKVTDRFWRSIPAGAGLWFFIKVAWVSGTTVQYLHNYYLGVNF